MGWELLSHFSRHSRCCLLSYVSPETWFVEVTFLSISRIICMELTCIAKMLAEYIW